MIRITTHPGEVLREEFMIPHGRSAGALARALDVPVNRVTEIIATVKPRAITPDTALRLSRYFWHYAAVLAEPPAVPRSVAGDGSSWHAHQRGGAAEGGLNTSRSWRPDRV